jgi:hypothetical protein
MDAAPAAVCLDVRSRHILAHVFAVPQILLEPSREIALGYALKLRPSKFPLNCLDRSLAADCCVEVAHHGVVRDGDAAAHRLSGDAVYRDQRGRIPSGRR